MNRQAGALIEAGRRLCRCLATWKASPPVAYVYNPLEYAWSAYSLYLERFAGPAKRVLLLGMNPGPWGMAQTGVPFGDVHAVRGWLGIERAVGRPAVQHPRRPVLGFACSRGEVSGRRLWGLMAERFVTAERFFRQHFVGNYCPLLFLDAEGRNITPDKLPAGDREVLFHCCDEHLRATIQALDPQWLIGIGRFAEKRLRSVQSEYPLGERGIAQILHPSPASPAANRGWAQQAAARMVALGIWEPTGESKQGS